MTINPERMKTEDLARGTMILYRGRCGGVRNMTGRQHMIYVMLANAVDALEGNYQFRDDADNPIDNATLDAPYTGYSQTR